MARRHHKRYLETVLYKAYADLRAEAERTYVGFLWWIIEPVIYMAIFYVVFGLLFQRGTEDFVPFLFVGLVTWRWLHTTLIIGSNSILMNRGLMQQVYLPKLIFPSVAILTNTLKFLLVFVLLLIFLWIYGYPVSATYTALVPVLAVELLFIMALTYLFAALVPFLPDISIVLDNVLRGLMFVSGVFFSIPSVPEHYQGYLYMNPMAVIIEAFRDVLLYNRFPVWTSLAVIALISLLFIFLGALLVRRNDYVYPKVVG